MESRKSPKRVAFIVAGVMAVAAGALVFAHSGGGHGMGPGLAMGEMSEHFQAHVKHVLAEVDATPEQQARVHEILQAASADLRALHGQHQDGHAELHRLLTAPAIDRARLEQLRARHVAALEAASQRFATALADAAEVLTPEQRRQLGERMQRRHSPDAKGIPHGG